MKIGILGTGDVGKALGKGFLAAGHEVMMGAREPQNPKAVAWAKEMGPKASHGTFRDAARFGEAVALATLGVATPDALRLAEPASFRGKLVLDATNPLDAAGGMPPKLVGGLGSSGGENHQRLLEGAHVVKCFNTVGNALFFRPKLPGGTPDMFLCGNDNFAKEKAATICREFGWNPIDIGGIDTAHYLEAMCLVWVLSALKSNSWVQAFKLLRP
jgi:predicted dinucleotide-binding enzyme